jgi:hypothetical protein
VGTGPRGGDAIARQAPEVAPLFTRRDELGEDMWLPIMFSPSKESQAAGLAFIARITARTSDRDIPVSDQTISAAFAASFGREPYGAAAAAHGTPSDRPPAVPAVSRCRARLHHGQAVTPALSVPIAV